MRLQKYLSSCGIASRRKAEEYILKGYVRVNGEVIKELGTKVSEEDEVYFKGKKVLPSKYIYIMLNKPTGYVTTLSDEKNRKIVIDLLDISERVYPIGRLDYDTSGLLLLTNDGELTNNLTHPKQEVPKKYIARLNRYMTLDDQAKFKNGILIEDYMTAKAKIRVIDRETNVVEIIITEGKNRQIRKMCEELGYKVFELERVSIGKIELGELRLGRYRYLTPEEVEHLKSF